jgi:hypothetical protein
MTGKIHCWLAAFVALTLAPCAALSQAAAGASGGTSGASGPSGASGAASGTPVVQSSPAPQSQPAGAEAVIYMPDGQLKSHSIRIYIRRNIEPGQNPTLRLLRSHATTKAAINEARILEPGVVAPGQEWVETVDGQQVRRTGTLLMFDLSQMDSGVNSMVRVTPVIWWTEGGVRQIAVGTREVNVGNIVATSFWTSGTIGLTVLIILFLANRGGKNPLELLAGTDGHLSLSQTQIACWTATVGGVVLGYGMIRLEIPVIPESLLVLMGASLMTGGLGFFKDAQKQQTAIAAGTPIVQRNMAIGDLVRTFPIGQDPELSLSKAQMLFWTVVLLVLFVSKSILDGGIWDMPWGLVALMGFSQVGYLAPKLTS